MKKDVSKSTVTAAGFTIKDLTLDLSSSCVKDTLGQQASHCRNIFKDTKNIQI